MAEQNDPQAAAAWAEQQAANGEPVQERICPVTKTTTCTSDPAAQRGCSGC